VSTDASDVVEFTVTMQYSYFITQDTDESVSPGIAPVPGG
jgi:hypothetical protein